MIKKFALLWAICLSVWSLHCAASANNFIRETERLIALSDKTYTVVVNQYEQTYSYWTGLNRLMVRVLDISTNEVVSEVLLSSVQIDTAMDAPFGSSYSALADEPQAMGNVLIQPQALFKNLEYPTYRFHIDSEGVFINREGRHPILDYAVVQSRFSEAGFDLNQAMELDTLEFTGWYKASTGKKPRYFFVLKLGRFDDDTGGLEYVFSIPDADS